MTTSRDTILAEVNEVPLISPHTMRILTLLSSPDYSVMELAGLVEADISLTAQCMKIVNSAALGLRNPVTSIQRCVQYLGGRSIAGIALRQNLAGAFTTPLTGYGSEESDLWNHSLRSAIAARCVATETSHDDLADVAYTAGLLHDIGKIIISGHIEMSEDLLASYQVGQENDFLHLETEILATDHTIIGHAIAQRWGLPEALRHAIRYHHTPSEAPESFQSLCMVVHLGDHLAMLGGNGTGADSLGYRIDPKAESFFTLQWNTLAKLLIAVDQEFCETTSMLEDSVGSAQA